MYFIAKIGAAGAVGFASTTGASAQALNANLGPDDFLLMEEAPLSETELKEARGGFKFGGFDFKFGIDIKPMNIAPINNPNPNGNGQGKGKMFGPDGVLGKGGVFGDAGAPIGDEGVFGPGGVLGKGGGPSNKTPPPASQSANNSAHNNNAPSMNTPAPLMTPVAQNNTPAPSTTMPVAQNTAQAPSAMQGAQSITSTPSSTPVVQNAAQTPSSTPVVQNAAQTPSSTPVAQNTAQAPSTTPVVQNNTPAPSTTPVVQNNAPASSTTPAASLPSGQSNGATGNNTGPEKLAGSIQKAPPPPAGNTNSGAGGGVANNANAASSTGGGSSNVSMSTHMSAAGATVSRVVQQVGANGRTLIIDNNMNNVRLTQVVNIEVQVLNYNSRINRAIADSVLATLGSRNQILNAARN